jgi:LDH2 family malate/lactate/ureidoglycolate dehydrogenase
MESSLLSDETILAGWKNSPRFPPEQLHRQIAIVFERFGLSAVDANQAAETLIAADWRGIESHGTANIPYYAGSFRAERIKPDSGLTVDRETPVSIAFDANHGSALANAPRAMRRCIEKARQTGICMATVRRSSHFGIAGYYALLAAEAGLIGMAMTNSGSLVAPTFGVDPLLGTNPIAVAVPTGDPDAPLYIDMSTSTVAYGKVAVAKRLGKPLPAGWALDRSGAVTTDPTQFHAILPLGGPRVTSGHKGYALGVLVEMLTGPLGAASFSWQIHDDKRAESASGTGHWFMAWQIDAFRDRDEFQADLRRMLADLRASRPDPTGPSDRVLVPGEPEAAQIRVNRIHGIPLRPEVVAELRAVCDDWGAEFILQTRGSH